MRIIVNCPDMMIDGTMMIEYDRYRKMAQYFVQTSPSQSHEIAAGVAFRRQQRYAGGVPSISQAPVFYGESSINPKFLGFLHMDPGMDVSENRTLLCNKDNYDKGDDKPSIFRVACFQANPHKNISTE